MQPTEKAEDRIVSFIKAKGPSTGFEIKEALDLDYLGLWRACQGSALLRMERVSRRYLRLDRLVEGFARLSPSILREFLTYTVIGLKNDAESLNRRAVQLKEKIEKINREKLQLARALATDIAGLFGKDFPERSVAFILAGDIVFHMAHDVPRPERSTGRLVRGSDIDLIVVVSDDLPESFVAELDQAIYREKYRMLVTPSINEEIDYIVKRFSRIREQADFGTFKHMVACKIMREGILLHGSTELFESINGLLSEAGVYQKLTDLEHAAETFRSNAEKVLLAGKPDARMFENLFYSAEESEEFE